MTTDTTDRTAVTQLEALATDLGARGFATTLVTGGRHPRLTVVNRQAGQLTEDIYAAPGDDARCWFWWSWAERIASAGDVDAAAFKIAHVLAP